MERDDVVRGMRIRVRAGAIVHGERVGVVVAPEPLRVDGCVGVRLDPTAERREAHCWVHHRDLEPEASGGA